MTTTDHETLDGSCCYPASTANDTDESARAFDSCCTDVAGTTKSTDSLEQVRGQGTTADVATIRSAAFRLLLQEGRPVDEHRLASASGLTVDAVADVLTEVRARGRVEFDEDGRLIGIAGLSLTPSRHQIEIEGTTRWTWCALDAVGILGALEANGIVRSTDPQSGAGVEIPFTAGNPDDDAALFILGGFEGGNVREEWCPLVNFFANREDAEEWVADHALEGDIVSVAAVASEAAEMWRPVVDFTAPQVC